MCVDRTNYILIYRVSYHTIRVQVHQYLQYRFHNFSSEIFLYCLCGRRSQYSYDPVITYPKCSTSQRRPSVPIFQYTTAWLLPRMYCSLYPFTLSILSHSLSFHTLSILSLFIFQFRLSPILMFILSTFTVLFSFSSFLC